MNRSSFPTAAAVCLLRPWRRVAGLRGAVSASLWESTPGTYWNGLRTARLETGTLLSWPVDTG